MAENIATNLGAGAAAEAASELVPDRWKSIAGMGGGLAGGVGTQLATSGAKTIPTMARGIYEYLQPALGAAGQKAEAARQFAGGLKSPAAVQDVLENEKRSLVPGSEPTTFELTGDIGAGQMLPGHSLNVRASRRRRVRAHLRAWPVKVHPLM